MKYLTTSPLGYTQLTHAFDMHSGERQDIEAELKRIRRGGRKAEIVVWDTRGSGQRTRVAVDKVTRHESVYGAIWTKETTK